MVGRLPSMSTSEAGPKTEILSVHDCWKYLRSSSVGRLAVIKGAAPQIFPVNYLPEDGTVIFRSGPGTKLDAVLEGGTVALEADGLNDYGTIAWSVVLKGQPEIVAVEGDELQTADRDLAPWEEGVKVSLGPSQDDRNTWIMNQKPHGPAVVLGVDGSAPSSLARRWANALAPLFQTHIKAVTAWQIQIAFGALIPVVWRPDKEARHICAEAVAKAFGGTPPEGREMLVPDRPQHRHACRDFRYPEARTCRQRRGCRREP